MKKDASIIATLALVGVTLLSGLILASSKASAEDSATTTASVTVPVACSMAGHTDTAHNASLIPGTYSGASGSEYEQGIGKTTLTTFCNDNNGFSIYAVGFTGDTLEGENHTKLVGTSASGNATIPTKVYESSDTASNWSMKVTKVENPSQGDPITYNPQNMNITNSFNSWHTIPDTYAKVAEYHATTGSSTTDTALGAKVETTYATYISTTQPADTYTGKVKYTMVHPYIFIPDSLNVIYNANGLAFANGEATNHMAYDAVKTVDPETIITKHARSMYNEDGTYNSYAAPGGNSVVTIPNASSIHIEVTIGVPQNNGGPPSDLYIWPGNHPDYTYKDNTTSLTSCGTATATDGAFHSTGYPGSQITIECDIVGDSVTFYDYSISTNGSVSTGYYATITNVGGLVFYTKNGISGTYSTPTGAPGSYAFYGWSENPNATSPAYKSEADIISKAPYTNQDGDVTLYAIWGHLEMQNLSANECTSTMSQVIDNRDGTMYNIQRLADGKCWLLDNLAIDVADPAILSGLNSNNTNASDNTLDYLKGIKTRNANTDPEGKYATSKVRKDWDGSYYSYSDPLINVEDIDIIPQGTDPIATEVQEGSWKVGAYYNYCAASAGSNCYGDGTTRTSITYPDNATEDICPAGWRMPSGGSDGDYMNLSLAVTGKTSSLNQDESIALRRALRSPLPGLASYSAGKIEQQGKMGYYWSSTTYSYSGKYVLMVSYSSVSPYTSSSYSQNGYSVRCILGSSQNNEP